MAVMSASKYWGSKSKSNQVSGSTFSTATTIYSKTVKANGIVVLRPHAWNRGRSVMFVPDQPLPRSGSRRKRGADGTLTARADD
jgi:hypothetical protein